MSKKFSAADYAFGLVVFTIVFLFGVLLLLSLIVLTDEQFIDGEYLTYQKSVVIAGWLAVAFFLYGYMKRHHWSTWSLGIYLKLTESEKLAIEGWLTEEARKDAERWLDGEDDDEEDEEDDGGD